VRTGTLRLIAAEGADRRRGAIPACRRISRNARSIVAALIASNPARTSGTSWTRPCRSIASTRSGSSGPQPFAADPVGCLPDHDQRLAHSVIVNPAAGPRSATPVHLPSPQQTHRMLAVMPQQRTR